MHMKHVITATKEPALHGGPRVFLATAISASTARHQNKISPASAPFCRLQVLDQGGFAFPSHISVVATHLLAVFPEMVAFNLLADHGFASSFANTLADPANRSVENVFLPSGEPQLPSSFACTSTSPDHAREWVCSPDLDQDLLVQ